MSEDIIFNLPEAAIYLKLQHRRVLRLAREKKIVAKKRGIGSHSWEFTKSALDNFLEKELD